MAVRVRQIRPPSVGLSCEDWHDEALCRGLPHYWFELQTFKESRREKQHKPIAKGLKVCSGCPVRAACKSDSSETDRHWTTRGGQPPEGLFSDSKEPRYALTRQANGFASGEGPQRTLKAKCKRGHEDWVTRKDGRRRCQSCQVEDNAGSWQRRKAKKAAKKSQSDA